MLTREDVDDADKELTPLTQSLWLNTFKSSNLYALRPWAYQDVQARIAQASGTVQGQMLNALFDQLQDLGPGESQLVAGTSRGGVQYSERLERDALIQEAFGVLYDYALIAGLYGPNVPVAVGATRPTFSHCPQCFYGPIFNHCPSCGWYAMG